MLLLVPLATLFFFTRGFARRGLGRTGALLAAAVASGLVASVGTEVLSFFSALTRGGVLALWLLALAAAIAWSRRTAGPLDSAVRDDGPIAGADPLLLGGVGLLLLLTATAAAFAGPTNWDSLTYHLPRIRHWLQDRGVANFSTANLRQLTLAPGAEILLAHARLLTGSDGFANFLQWGAFAGAILAARRTAALLGGGTASRVNATLFAATLPMALLQASGTQNDLVVSFWLLAFAPFVLEARGSDAARPTLLAGGALALSVWTKATAYLFGAPFLVWLVLARWKRRGFRAAGELAIAAGLVVVVNAGPWLRNAALFGSPLGPSYDAVNAVRTPAILASNALRNLALHLETPSVGWNRSVEDTVRAAHRLLGVGVDDMRSTWKGAQFRVPPGLRGETLPDADAAALAAFDEDRAGNPVHVLFLAAAVTTLAIRHRRGDSPAAAYLGALAAGAFLFVTVLRWQPWNARLHLPLFLLAAPLAGFAAERWSPVPRRVALAALLLPAFLWPLAHASRPLAGPASVLVMPRADQAFAALPGSREPLRAAARVARADGCDRVGLVLGPDDPEYLLWLSLDESARGGYRAEQVEAPNRSARLSASAGFAPCTIVTLARPGGRQLPPDASFRAGWPGGAIAVERRR